jgi:putative flippase GtrA
MRIRVTGRPARYIVVGAWNTAFGLGCFSVLYLLLGSILGYLGVLTIAQLVAVIQAHWTQRILVWRSRAWYVPELIRFSSVYVGSFFANALLLTLAVDGLGLPALPAQWVIGAGLLIPAYLVQRVWAFRDKGPKPGVSKTSAPAAE